MKKLILLFGIISALSACKKDEKSTRVIEGYIYHDCALNPLQNNITYTVEGVKVNLGKYNYTYLGSVSLDENGYYKLTYESDENFNEIRLVQPGFGAVITLYGYQNQINTTNYIKPKTKHRVVLQVSDTMSIYDTLYFTGVGLKDSLITGPFHDGQSFEIEMGTNVGRANGNDFVISSATGVGDFLWFIGWDNWKQRNNPNIAIPPYRIRGFNQPVCGQGETIYIDLRNE